MNIEPAAFPGSVWDGLNYQFTTLDHDKSSDAYSKDRITSEIQAIESYLTGFSDLFTFFSHYTPANALVTVNSTHTGLVYRTLTGDGIEIVFTPDEIQLKNLGLWSEQVENDSGSPATIGQVVYLKANGKFALAQADTLSTSEILGLVADSSILNGSIGTIQITGPLTTTITNWDALTGQIGGLIPNTIYYLSPVTAGKLTTTLPTNTSDCLVRVGKAITATKLLIYPREPIIL
jgi:hypothetical protein